MIKVTRLSGEMVVINAELIETVEATPDTVITLTTGKKLVVVEEPEEVVERVMAYRREAYRFAGASALGALTQEGGKH